MRALNGGDERKSAEINRCLYILLMAASGISVSVSAQTAAWRSTTNANQWVDNGTLSSTEWTPTANYIEVFPDTLYQTIAGFGGCFSEKGWDLGQGRRVFKFLV